MQSFEISSFGVHGLYGQINIDVPIRDNRVVIVGANGLGKSTFLSFFYHFISCQWSKLLEYDFRDVSAVVNGRDISVTRDEMEGRTLELFQMEASRSGGSGSPRVRTVLRRAATDGQFAEVLRLNITSPPSRIINFLRSSGMPSLTPGEIRDVRSFILHDRGPAVLTTNVREVRNFLEEAISSQMLYLPTYRRIEKDLDIVFPGLEDELRSYREGRRRPRLDREASFLELVEFGMEDVDNNIQRTLVQQKEAARNELSNLAGSYLRDVLRGEGSQYDAALISELSDDAVEDILNRVEERTLSEHDKARLRTVIRTIKENGQLDASGGYVAHFFEKLVSSRQKLRANEASISEFARVCNSYLDGKEFVYDDVNYLMPVISNGKTIELAFLSSGEKQIVSLFSQMYIGAAESYIVAIDEPELSLSVSWQEKLLPDLQRSGRCKFVIVVTHSPFIFNNDFDAYAVDLSQCVSHDPEPPQLFTSP
jgi:predicted ATPase